MNFSDKLNTIAALIAIGGGSFAGVAWLFNLAHRFKEVEKDLESLAGEVHDLRKFVEERAEEGRLSGEKTRVLLCRLLTLQGEDDISCLY
jgi:hypothetical protein